MKLHIKKVLKIILIIILLVLVCLTGYFYFFMNTHSVILTHEDQITEYYIPDSFTYIEEQGSTTNLLIHIPLEERWSLRYWQYMPRLTELESTMFLQFKNKELVQGKSFIRNIYGNRQGVFELEGDYELKEDSIKNIHLYSISDKNTQNTVEYKIKKIDLNDAMNKEGIESEYINEELQEYIKPPAYR